jgi:phosphoesterase RecJ-like protein
VSQKESPKRKQGNEKPETDRENVFREITSLFENNSTFIITGHINPDGDTVGSGLALASWLISMGKSVDIVNVDPTPGYLDFLKDSDVLKRSAPQDAEYDVAVILECPELSRAGGSLSRVTARNVLNIDHHIAGKNIKPGENRLNLVDESASSCAELVFRLMKFSGHTPTKEEAAALFTGIVTDTNRFQQANTTPGSLTAAAELVRAGVSIPEITRRIYNIKRYQALKVLGMALMTLKQEGPVAYMKVTREAARKTGASQEDMEEIVNCAGMLPGVEVYALFRELGGDKNVTKVSLRSHSSVNVNAIAEKYGGGGHFHAAGFKFEGTADETVSSVVPVLSAAVREND